MGTNYYARYDTCPMCGRHESIHIGKKAAGWKFCFEAHKEPELTTVDQYKSWLQNMPIYDEYGCQITYEAFWEMVDASRWERRSHAQEYPGATEYECDGLPFSTSAFS